MDQKAMSLIPAAKLSRAWLAAPAVAFALVSLTVGLLAKQTLRSPYATPFFHFFFTDILHRKIWLATLALVLALPQLVTAARIYRMLHFPPPGRFYNFVHRCPAATRTWLTVPGASR